MLYVLVAFPGMEQFLSVFPSYIKSSVVNL